jgi:tetratricopeptide (TPR) repeat protein
MGGIGKTELALQYAIEQMKQGQYPAGFCWLRTRDREIATELVTYAQIYLGLNVPEQLEIDAQVRFCWQHWPSGEVLVVLDDVTDFKAIKPYLPPADPRFKLLITTRLDLGSTVQKIDIEELDEESAIALLESLVGEERVRSQLVDVQALCKWVGYLPLALELLGRFLERRLDWSISRLFKTLKENRLGAKALIIPEFSTNEQLSVAATLELSWHELNELDQELACVLGLFAIAPIPWFLVESCLPEIDSEYLEDIRDNGLLACSLLRWVGNGSYQLHPIVQEYFRVKLGQRVDQGQTIKVTFWQVMVGISKTIDYKPTINQIELVRDVITHLEEGTRSWLDSIADDDLIWPFVGIGNFYEGQGKYSLAEPWYRDCLKVAQERLGEEHLSVVTSFNNLALLCLSLGKYEEAEFLLQDALEMDKHLLGEEHPDVTTVLNNLAESYYLQEKYGEAEPLYLLVLERRNLLGGEHLAVSINNLANLYYSQEKYGEAEPLYRLALEMRRNLLGGEHLDVAGSINNLANFYYSQEKYEEAEPLYLLALEMRRNLLGGEHPDVAVSINSLADLYYSQEKYEEAEPLYLLVLEIRRKLLGEENLDVAASMKDLADLYYSQEKYEETEPLYLLALEMRRNLLGGEHPDVAVSINSLADLYYSQEKYEEAEPLYLLALEIRKKLLGEENIDVAASMKDLADLFYLQNKYEEAEALYLLALEIRRKLLGEGNLDVVIILNKLGNIYELQEKYEEAELTYLSVLELYKRVLGEQHINVAMSQFNLGVLYKNQGRYSESEALCYEALAIFEAKLGLTHPTTQGILSCLNSLPVNE